MKTLPWQMLSEAYAFIGNSLLKPMTQTAQVGIRPEFWEAFPSFDDDAVAADITACKDYAEEAVEQVEKGLSPVERAAIEYTRLFIGPQKLAAAPWETMYRGEDVTVGFGQATFEMRKLLRDAGLQLSNENHQYEDHIGIELLYLSELCRRMAVEPYGDDDIERAVTFIKEHPLSWIDALRSQVAQAGECGYIYNLLGLAESLLRLQVAKSTLD